MQKGFGMNFHLLMQRGFGLNFYLLKQMGLGLNFYLYKNYAKVRWSELLQCIYLVIRFWSKLSYSYGNEDLV